MQWVTFKIMRLQLAFVHAGQAVKTLKAKPEPKKQKEKSYDVSLHEGEIKPSWGGEFILPSSDIYDTECNRSAGK